MNGKERATVSFASLLLLFNLLRLSLSLSSALLLLLPFAFHWRRCEEGGKEEGPSFPPFFCHGVIFWMNNSFFLLLPLLLLQSNHDGDRLLFSSSFLLLVKSFLLSLMMTDPTHTLYLSLSRRVSQNEHQDWLMIGMMQGTYNLYILKGNEERGRSKRW